MMTVVSFLGELPFLVSPTKPEATKELYQRRKPWAKPQTGTSSPLAKRTNIMWL